MTQNMKILALDPATKCGWAIGVSIGGVWDCSIRRDESSGMRLIRLRGKLNEVVLIHRPKLIVFEAARNAGPKMQGALVVQSELQGVIKAFCHDANIEYRGYSPSEIKKFITGKGNANKKAVQDAVVKRYPMIALADDNHADAVALWALAQKEYGGKDAL